MLRGAVLGVVSADFDDAVLDVLHLASKGWINYTSSDFRTYSNDDDDDDDNNNDSNDDGGDDSNDDGSNDDDSNDDSTFGIKHDTDRLVWSSSHCLSETGKSSTMGSMITYTMMIKIIIIMMMMMLPWEKLSLAMFMPLSIRPIRPSTDQQAGPKVHTTYSISSNSSSDVVVSSNSSSDSRSITLVFLGGLSSLRISSRL